MIGRRLLLYPLVLGLLVTAAWLADVAPFWRVLLIGLAPALVVWGLEGGPRLVLALGLVGPAVGVGLGSGPWWALAWVVTALVLIELGPPWLAAGGARPLAGVPDAGGDGVAMETVVFLAGAGLLVTLLLLVWAYVPVLTRSGWPGTLAWSSALGLAGLALLLGSGIWSLRALRG